MVFGKHLEKWTCHLLRGKQGVGKVRHSVWTVKF